MSAKTTTKPRFRAGWAAITLAGLMVLAACGDDEDGAERGGTDGNCTHSFICENGACECTTTGKEGSSCCDPDDCSDSSSCEVVCEVCS